MGIIAWPDDVHLNSQEQCAICKEYVSLEDLTIGMCDFEGVQRFACLRHCDDVRSWLLGWVDFVVDQYWIHGTDSRGKRLGDFDDL